MAKTTVERRAHARFPHTFDLEGGLPGGTVARMVASDLSLGGLYCTSTSDIPEMTRLAVRLMLPSARPTPGNGVEPLDVEAVVVRRRRMKSATGNDGRYELALYFTGMSDGSRERLARWLAQGSN